MVLGKMSSHINLKKLAKPPGQKFPKQLFSLFRLVISIILRKVFKKKKTCKSYFFDVCCGKKHNAKYKNITMNPLLEIELVLIVCWLVYFFSLVCIPPIFFCAFKWQIMHDFHRLTRGFWSSWKCTVCPRYLFHFCWGTVPSNLAAGFPIHGTLGHIILSTAYSRVRYALPFTDLASLLHW